jgi:hypothetical protein
MPGKLRCDSLDLSAKLVVKQLLYTLSSLADGSRNWHHLEVRKQYYFATPGKLLSNEAGWYIICDADRCPIYVGIAKNLNVRLNSENGSRDNFANPQRTSDPERNFIKAFVSSGLLGSLEVLVIQETLLCSAMQMPSPLSDRDRKNIEKTINLFRERILR